MRAVLLKGPSQYEGTRTFIDHAAPALTRRGGYSILQIDIEDRARVAGVSKYGFFDRLFAGIFDLFGVFWLMRRGTPAQAEELPRA